MSLPLVEYQLRFFDDYVQTIKEQKQNLPYIKHSDKKKNRKKRDEKKQKKESLSDKVIKENEKKLSIYKDNVKIVKGTTQKKEALKRKQKQVLEKLNKK
ncbi:hypothetical protein ABK040_009683 [Willaertia magna]